MLTVLVKNWSLDVTWSRCSYCDISVVKLDRIWSLCLLVAMENIPFELHRNSHTKLNLLTLLETITLKFITFSKYSFIRYSVFFVKFSNIWSHSLLVTITVLVFTLSKHSYIKYNGINVVFYKIRSLSMLVTIIMMFITLSKK